MQLMLAHAWPALNSFNSVLHPIFTRPVGIFSQVGTFSLGTFNLPSFLQGQRQEMCPGVLCNLCLAQTGKAPPGPN